MAGGRSCVGGTGASTRDGGGGVAEGVGRWLWLATRVAAPAAGPPENQTRAGPSQSVTTAAPMPHAQKVAVTEPRNQSLTSPLSSKRAASTESTSRALWL